jgi:hypothetical protein
MEDPNEPGAPPSGGAEEPEPKRVREIQITRHYINDLFILFDKNKDLIAKTLADLSPAEIFVVTREATGDRTFSEYKKLWKLIATQKYSTRKIVELENLLFDVDPKLPETTPLVPFGDKIDYFRLMVSDYIVHHHLMQFKRSRHMREKENDPFGNRKYLTHEEWRLFLFSNPNVLSISKPCVFQFIGGQFDGTVFRLRHRLDNYQIEQTNDVTRSCLIVCESAIGSNHTIYVLNYATKILQMVLGVTHFDCIRQFVNFHERSTIEAFLRTGSSESLFFKIVYGILRIPHVTVRMEFENKDDPTNPEVLNLKNKISF